MRNECSQDAERDQGMKTGRQELVCKRESKPKLIFNMFVDCRDWRIGVM